MTTILTGRKRIGAEAWVLATLLCALGCGARLGFAQKAESAKAEPVERLGPAENGYRGAPWLVYSV